MKKCSNPECGLEVETKFCPECGCETIDTPINHLSSSIIIICDGKNKSGSPCRAELRTTQKFCTSCGKQVDVKLFEVQSPDIEKCGRCGTALSPGEQFCPECGLDVEPITKQGQRLQNQHGPEADRPSEERILQGETSIPELKEEHPQPNEKVDSAGRKATNNTANDAINISNLPRGNQVCIVNLDDGIDESKQETLMQDGPGCKIDEANTIANINDSNCLPPNEIKGGDLLKQSDIHKDSASAEVGHTKAGNDTSESQLDELLKDTHLTHDETKNEASCSEEIPNDESDKDGEGSDDDSTYSDSSKSVVKDDDTEETQQMAHGKKRTKGNLNRGTKAKRMKKREKKKEKHLKKHSLSSDKKDEENTDRTTRNKTMAERKMLEQAIFNAIDNESTDSNAENQGIANLQQQEMVFGKRNTQSSSFNTNIDTSDKEIEGRNMASFFKDITKSNVSAEHNTHSSPDTQKDEQLDSSKQINASPKSHSSSSQTGTQTNGDSSNTKKKKEQVNQESRDRKAKNKITVVFHVLVSKDFLSGDRDNLFLKIDERFGGWNTYKHQPKPVRELKEYVEYEYHLQFDRDEIIERTTDYKYCVRQHDGKCLYEHYVDHIHGNHNRKLFLERKLVGKKEFAPFWFQQKFNLEEFKETFQISLERLEMLITGLRKVYQRDARCWESEEKYRNQICRHLFQPLIDQLTSDKYGSRSFRLLRALAIIIACNRIQVGLDQSAWQILCANAMVTPDPTNKKYAEVDDIRNFFDLSALKPALINVIRNVVMFGKDPSWMFCLPLLHFTSKLCEPFEEMVTNLTHAAVTPTWWGIADIETEVVAFQNTRNKWITSIVASLTVEEIFSVIDNKVIPAEVCCATLLHWMKATNPEHFSNKYLYEEYKGAEKLVTQCLAKVLKRMQTADDESAQNHRTPASFGMAYCIARELVDCAVTRNRMQKLMHSLHIFLQCLSFYSKLETKGNENKNDIENAVDTVEKEVLHWCEHYASFYNCISLKNLKLTTNINRKKDFIRIYCAEVETFNTTMKGCLTNIAVKAIDEGYMIEYKDFGSSEKERFRDLLSDLFRQRWRTEITNETLEAKDLHIFKMAISWPPIQLFVRNQRKVDTKSIDEVLQKTTKLEKHYLMEFCKPKPVQDVDGNIEADLKAFNVEPDVLDILPTLECLAEGFVFKKIWRETCSGTTEVCETPLDVVNVVWKHALKRWKEFCKQLDTGELEFAHAEKMFGILKNNDQELLREMQNLISKEKATGQKELKVFVDLAMMSAGEEPMNIGKVQCLHSAVLGYSPLIFELDATKCDFRKLLDMCKVVWKELAVNPNLPQQLLDTNSELEWLKDIKKAHGSVEVTSLMQADAINADGIYTVGKGAWKGSELSDMIVKDIIKLTVPEKEGQRQLRRYTFDHLQDLQSRLMLVAGKSDSSSVKPTADKKSEVNVDRFTMIFDSMTRLGIVYLKLCSSGCVLFNGWNANFVCSPGHDRPVCATLEFGKGKYIPKLKGRRSDTEALEDMVPKIAEFMEKCYGEWLEFIKEKRKIYLYLNFFTIAQLVILQRELVKMGTDEEPSLRIYHLMSAVKENCTQEDVVLAMEKAKRQLFGRDNEPEETIDEIDNQEEMSAFGDEKIARFVRELVEAGCDETVARKSVHIVNQEDIDECDVTEAMIWCMDQTGEANEDGEMNQYDVKDLQHTNPMFSGWSHTKTSISSVIKQSVTSVGHEKKTGVKPLINDLTELWKNFLGSISSNISDYLSLEHLGIILNMLAETDEVLRVALSIYMHDSEQPLPQSDEVLVCTSDTTADEVSIFWRRAIYDSSGKIHCLLYADLLDFDVSEAAEQCLEELLLDIQHSHDEEVQAQIHRKNKWIDTQKVSIPLQEKVINLHNFTQTLLEHTPDPRKQSARIFHLNMNHEVQEGVDYMLFNLLILNCLVDKSGYVWRRSVHDLYLIEAMPIMFQASDGNLFDEKQFRSPVFQRTFQYLLRLDQQLTLDSVNPLEPEGDPKTCLVVLLRHCGVRDPSWSELNHFVWFLNTQLVDFEQNQFVSVAAAEDLPGFGIFVLRFLIQMSRDFSTRSLSMSEESPGMIQQDAIDTEDEDELELYQMRRTWESSPHPYLFFNSDRFTFTFLGFYIDRNTGNLVDQQTDDILEQKIMSQQLYDSLVRNRAPIRENFDALPRDQKIMKLCSIMGVEFPHDPDSTYELTTDNVKKIMAIYMRFRCDIPVIIMGETGCGKTRLIKFMCALQSPPGVDVKNMILMKVHGGTTTEDIERKVNVAEVAARVNIEEYGRHMYTVLFFDEANTTEAIGLIKEIMCDKSIAGKRLALCENLKIVAACNPYRKHSDELIKKLEQAGLGYHVDADETTDRLGRVPMRRLVYRVQPLPQSLLPLVWDFGQLNTQIEELYIRQMVRRYIYDDRLPDIPNLIEVVSRILTVSQVYMRAQRDECSFVSLRDVERVLTVMAWFYDQGEDGRSLFEKMDRKVIGSDDQPRDDSDEEEETEDEEIYLDQGLDNITRALVLALGVCYHSCLKTRQEYRQAVVRHFRQPFNLQGGEAQMLEEIERIPLFLVGKPGSSKSLAKTIVSDAMQGNSAKHDLFKSLKQVQMVSFQCSPLSTPDGIVGTFRQCAQFQKDKDLQTFVSAVVLDEVGLAEDSPRMPLKTLHPLLEDGCQGDEDPEPFLKVAFIGISNWALDPAKMNRGILVQREVPDLEELQNSARGICGSSEDLGNLIEPLSKSYLDVFAQATEKMREFFGLRDFYSLVKMVYNFVEKSHKPPTWYEMLHAILRNFGGLDQVNPEEIFKKHLARVISCNTEIRRLGDPDCSPAGLIQACLFDTHKTGSSSFKPKAMKYDQSQSLGAVSGVCRNINKIKVCMETGNTVVLLNLENLYESLYDALNQYYVYFGGERYVDLGLGTHRVKCPVHRNFRLIVVAEKQTVYKKFPIPLINRLEKHFLTVKTTLNDRQQRLVSELEKWASDFASQTDGTCYTARNIKKELKIEDIFIGYHRDSCSAIILDVSQTYQNAEDIELLEAGKLLLLWCATPESVERSNKLDESQRRRFQKYYYERQAHVSLVSYLKLKKEKCRRIFAQVTTHSKLLASIHKKVISLEIGIDVDRIFLLETLSSFDTEQQFTNRVQQHLERAGTDESLMLIQCDSGDVNANLIACARYIVMDEYEKARKKLRAPVHAVFIVQLPRKAGGCFTGFQCGRWHSAHIDDLCPESTQMPDIQYLQGKTVSSIFHNVGEKQSHHDEIEGEQGEEMDRTDNRTSGTQMPGKERGIGEGGNMDVDEMDIDVEFNIQMLEVDREQKKQDVIKSALAMVKDKKGYTQRETRRVDIVMKCLRNAKNLEQGVDTFLTGLQRLIGQLLKEKEEKKGGKYIAQLWMTREAAAPENINKAGTFRRSCHQTIISKVSPILAGIIAYLDTNRNLDLIHSDVWWKRTLWTSVLNTEGAIKIQYSDLQSPKRRSDLGEMLVMTTGFQGHMFSACLPFSWMMKEMIADILHDILPSDEEYEDEQSREVDEQSRKVASCAKIVSASQMGKILNQLILSEEVDMKEQKSLEGVEKFLKMCNQQALKLFYGTEIACCACEKKLQGAPVTLPCNDKDVICDSCLREMKALDQDECPKCHENLGLQWQPMQSEKNSKQREQLIQYQKRCNAFFMDVIAQLCFADGLPPSKNVLEKLLGYVTCFARDGQLRFTKNLTIFETGLDPNPIFRSFLLQLMLKSSEEEFVKKSLRRYIEQAHEIIRKEPALEQNLLELSLLIIQCLETQEVSDRYVVCEEDYVQIREALSQVILGEDISTLEYEVQSLKKIAAFLGTTENQRNKIVKIVRSDIEEDNIRQFSWEHIEANIHDLQRALGRSHTLNGDIYLLQTKQGRQAWEKQFANVFLQDVFQKLDHHLKHFNQDHILQAIQSIPSILSLQRILLQKFQRKLDKAEANTILVKDMIKEQLAGPDTEKLLQDFGHAWDITRKLLELYVCTTEFGSIVVPKNQCANPISAETPLSVFLPTSTENGLCSYAMLDLLFRKQNEFLDGYMKESERSTSIETVTPQQATSAHLISYNHEQDILPLVLANCRYTFEMGKGTKIKYDFAGLESQIMDRFLFSKSRIDIGNYLQIDQMVYRTEFTNAAVFEILEEKIPQRALGIAVKKQISEEIKSLPDLCRFLDNLDIAISFLKTTGGNQSENMNTFMVETLQMEHAMTSQKAQQSCEFQHAKSLWLLLSYLKSKFMVDNFHSKQEVFETLLEPYHDELSEELHKLGEELLAFVELMETPCIDTFKPIVVVFVYRYIMCHRVERVCLQTSFLNSKSHYDTILYMHEHFFVS
ncbi:R213A-like protein [Mya arenaria]|uniref:R213A-like protein n=1 Tax=Mya arenaria TaxID=6604 RepID=A0ABY7EEW1_MYAAR|nr:R213A-like protein [Mya arenaria]